MKYGLDEIKTFLAVVESGSISGASTRLAITKSVVSPRVTHLEAALGVELLHRSSRGVTPTDRGRVFHEGYISDPVGKAKSVVFTEVGLRESERLFNQLFVTDGQ